MHGSTVWICEDGRAITNAWADPTAVLPSSVISLIDSLKRKQRTALSDRLGTELMKQLDVIDDFAASTTPEIESEYREEWMPPEAIAYLRARTVDELSEELGAVDFR